MKRIVVTGSGGLIGWHAQARLHAQNCAAGFRKEPLPFDIVALDHAAFDDDAALDVALTGAFAVLHFAGVNRAPDDVVEKANPAIAARLVAACKRVGATPHIVYANSTHATSDTPYGRSKRMAAEALAAFTPRFTNLILPHIFGEGARAFYNNVTATLIHQVIAGEQPNINPDGRVNLLHAGEAAQAAIDSALNSVTGTLQPQPRPISVPDLYVKIQAFHTIYMAMTYPDLRDPFDAALFNSYRAALYPNHFPMALKLNTDPRGTLFEAVRGGGGGQTFLSWTNPGITRGDHFHLAKVERFLVLQGEATIRIRRVLHDETWSYAVTGDKPVVIDMPCLFTHSIENTGSTPLLTLFWAHEIFDPARPDTYFDPVLRT